MRIELKLRLHQSYPRDIDRGIVRIHEDDRGLKLAYRQYIRLRNLSNGRTTFCQVRGWEKGDEKGSLGLNEALRQTLGLTTDDLGKLLDFEVTTPVLVRFRALISSPDEVVRAGILLATLSVVLGFLGIIVAISPPLPWLFAVGLVFIGIWVFTRL